MTQTSSPHSRVAHWAIAPGGGSPQRSCLLRKTLPQLPQSLCLGRSRRAGDRRSVLRTQAPRLLPLSDARPMGGSGEGPDAAKAEGRRVSCERGEGCSSSALVSWAEGGKGPPQPASQKVPRTPGQVPERQGRRLEGIIGLSIIITPPGKGTGGGGGWGCVGVSEGREENVGVFVVSLSLSRALFCGCFGAGNPGVCCVYGFFLLACTCMHAGQATAGGRPEPVGRRLPADSESSEFPRIDQPAQPASQAQSQPSPAQPEPPSPCAGVGVVMLRSRTVCVGVWYMCVCGVYVSVCLYVCICMYVLGGGHWVGLGTGAAADAAQNPPKLHTYIQGRAGQHIVCGHCSCRGLLQISRPGPPAAPCAHSPPVSLRDRRGLYFGGGCLIPRADPGLWVWVCLGPLPRVGVCM